MEFDVLTQFNLMMHYVFFFVCVQVWCSILSLFMKKLYRKNKSALHMQTWIFNSKMSDVIIPNVQPSNSMLSILFKLWVWHRLNTECYNTKHVDFVYFVT